MHIVHLTPYYAPAYSFGGVVRMVEGLAQAQQARGHRITILTTDALSVTERIPVLNTVENGIQVIRCRNLIQGLRRFNLSTPIGLRQEAKRLFETEQVDVLHIHEFRTAEAWLIAPLARQSGIATVLSPHGTLTHSTGRSALKSVWDSVLSPSVAKNIQHVIALTDDERDEVRALWSQWADDIAVSVVPNGVDLQAFTHLPHASSFRARYGLSDKRVVLFMGRLHQRKGVDVLAKAFLQADIPNTVLVLAGPDEGMLSTLEALNDERIILTGFLDGEARLQTLASAELFALPATGEGLSMAVLEAMAAGLPVLLSPGCHLPQVAQAGAGMIVEPTISVLAKALSTMLGDEASLATMSENSRQL
ncbi:MAG: glycosyltransferase, partial [Chloroflexota bacterium]